jgi:large subunit ribosomal protein L5
MSKHLTVKEKNDQAYEALKADFGLKNKMAAPRLVKVVIATATGTGMKKDPKRNEHISGRLAKITGQRPTVRAAKKSIASFKIRTGDPVGVAVTLRGARMYGFLEKLINIAFPRTKDFRGIDRKNLDNIGNLSMGIKEHTIFPETGDEDIRDVFGMAITIVTTAKDKKEGEKFFEYLGIPFKKKAEAAK